MADKKKGKKKAALTRSQTVMQRGTPAMHTENQIYFTGDRDSHRDTVLLLDRELFGDMGEPKEVTVTIEKGDALNAQT